MITLATRAIRMIIPVLLFQFLAPAFLPAQEGRDQDFLCYQAVQSTVISPTFLKEIEEENGTSVGDEKFIFLLDLTCHFDNLNLSACSKKWSVWRDHEYGGHAVLYYTLYRILRV